jgi:hypothetical protein
LQPLPSLIHIRAEESQSVPSLKATLKFLAAESTSAAGPRRALAPQSN